MYKSLYAPRTQVKLGSSRKFKNTAHLLVAEHAIGERLSASVLAWPHSGFSVHNAVRVRAGNAAGRKKLTQYMLRAPFSLEKMTSSRTREWSCTARTRTKD